MSLPPPHLELIGLQLFGDRLQLFNQFPKRDGATQRRRGYRAASQMAFRMPGQVKTGIPRDFDALLQLIQKSIDDGDDIHIPGV